MSINAEVVSFRSEKFFSIASLGIIPRLAIIGKKRMFVFTTDRDLLIKAIDNRHDTSIEKVVFSRNERQRQIDAVLNFYDDLSNFENNGRIRYVWLKNWINYVEDGKKVIRDNAALLSLFKEYLSNGKIKAEEVLKWKAKGCPR